ncbi:hypothetical protein HK100_004263 [Physocladia obscura]|uniref:AAA+ ATPase domain-containing protein n=1 Tax=Physocladia obscura TaxID=109957 RepID=A0AAD5SVK9_9FUNG|nr:hypothetical protein HK100_004263 [Physocladia obscura]
MKVKAFGSHQCQRRFLHRGRRASEGNRTYYSHSLLLRKLVLIPVPAYGSSVVPVNCRAFFASDASDSNSTKDKEKEKEKKARVPAKSKESTQAVAEQTLPNPTPTPTPTPTVAPTPTPTPTPISFTRRLRNGIESFVSDVGFAHVPLGSPLPFAPININEKIKQQHGAAKSNEEPSSLPPKYLDDVVLSATIVGLRSALLALLFYHPTVQPSLTLPAIPSAASGLVVLSCPYKGSDRFCRMIVERLINETPPLQNAAYFHVRPENLFARIAPANLTKIPPVTPPIDTSTADAATGKARLAATRRPPAAAAVSQISQMFGGAIMVEVGSNGRAKISPNKLSSGGGSDLENDVPMLPYPWYQPYMSGSAKQPGNLKSLMIPRIQSEFGRTFYYESIHKTFEQFFEKVISNVEQEKIEQLTDSNTAVSADSPEITVSAERKNGFTPRPIVIYFEDLLDIITPNSVPPEDPSFHLDESEIINSFAYCLHKARQTRPIVVITASTPSTRAHLVNSNYSRPNNSHNHPLSSIFKAIQSGGGGNGDGNGDARSSKSSTRSPGVSFGTSLDDYIGPAVISVIPAFHKGGGAAATTQFKKKMQQDLKLQIRETNRREMAVIFNATYAHDSKLVQNMNRLLERVFEELEEEDDATLLLPVAVPRLREFRILDDLVLTPNDVEKILLYAAGRCAKRICDGASVGDDSELITFQDLKTSFSIFSDLLKGESEARSGNEFATVFANPADHMNLTKHESEILKVCLIKPADLQASFNAVGGLQKTKQVIEELIRLPLLRPELFSFGVLKHSTTGLLLFGPPGTGKTMLAKAVAAESGANFLNIQMSSIQSKWVGENEKNVKAIFTLARKLKPCVIFVDEIDSLLRVRVHNQPHWVTNTINEWMLEWDGINSKGSDGIIVVGATNRPFDLDEAVLRRLPRRLFVNLPDLAERTAILEIILAEEQVGSAGTTDENSLVEANEANEARKRVIEFVAEKTRGFSGSDLKNLCIAAALGAVRRMMKVADDAVSGEGGAVNGVTVGADEIRVLLQQDFEKAFESGDVVPSLSDKAELMNELIKWDKLYGLKAGKRGAGGNGNGWGFGLSDLKQGK